MPTTTTTAAEQNSFREQKPVTVDRNEKELADILYSLKLGEEIQLKNNDTMLRVPGGWVFMNAFGGSTCFIPYNSEFMTNRFKQ